MFDWIKKLLGAGDDDVPSGVLDEELLRGLQEELTACERLYRTGALLCARTCPESIGPDWEKFLEHMLELHQQLLVRILLEIARGDREWNAAEREVAFVLL